MRDAVQSAGSKDGGGTDTPVAELSGVTKRYGSQTAVADLDLAIDAGQFVTLLGPSGCGKSTTLRMLGGFERPTAGRIVLNGRDVTNVPPHRRDVNTVFQDYALFPHLDVARNVAFGLELKGLRSDAITRRVEELLRLVHLEAFADRLPGQLSGGQRQRVALIRALAPDPQLLLLDEPLSALDAKLRGEMQLELKEVQRTTGKTFVFVTHDQEEALTMSDVVVVMNAGRIEQMGPPQALYASPRTHFVATFIGAANLLAVTVAGAEGERVTASWQGTTVGARANGTQPVPGMQATLVIRPENVRLGPAAGTGDAMAARIVTRAFKGAHNMVTLRMPTGATLQAQVHASDVAALSAGEVAVSWSPQDAVLIEARPT